MKKNLNWLVCGVSGLSLVLSVVAVCVACCHTPDLGFDYQGVIVGVLSLLVTVLIGWNIYSVIDLKDSKNKIDAIERDFGHKLSDAIENAKLNLKIEMMDSSTVLQAAYSGDLINTLTTMFKEYHRATDGNSITKTLSRSYIVTLLSPFAENGKDAALSENLINDLCRHVTYEEVDCFMHDFLSVPDGRNHPQAHELSQLLQRLILATLQGCHGQKAK